MFIIFGCKDSIKDLGIVGKKACPHCHNEVDYHLIQVKSYFHIFYIKLIPYRTKRYVQCPICNYGYEFDKNEPIDLDRI